MPEETKAPEHRKGAGSFKLRILEHWIGAERQRSSRAGSSHQAESPNALVLGDNLQLLRLLTTSPHSLKPVITTGVKLIYIDPPYAVGNHHKYRIEVGGEDGRQVNSIERIAYTDKWHGGITGYLRMLRPRLELMHSLLRPDGAILVHIDWRVTHHVRLMLDKIFGPDNFRNEIIWAYRSGGASRTGSLSRKHDTILMYAKSPEFKVNALTERQYLNKPFMGSKQDESGRYYVDTILRDIIEGEINIVGSDGDVVCYNTRPVLNLSTERLGYSTQKPEGLMSLLIKLTSSPGDLVADFFCGSGTTLAVANALNRKWLGCDGSRLAIHTSHKRLVGEPEETQVKLEYLNDFLLMELLLNEPDGELIDRSLDRVTKSYGVENLTCEGPGGSYWAGHVPEAYVFIPASNQDVTSQSIVKLVEKVDKKQPVHILLWPGQEPSLHEIQDFASIKGWQIHIRRIPESAIINNDHNTNREAFEYLVTCTAELHMGRDKFSIRLKSYAPFACGGRTSCPQAFNLKKGCTRTILENGHAYRIAKDRANQVSVTPITEDWPDWIDYWSVGYAYHNEYYPMWLSYRQKKDRGLALLCPMLHQGQMPPDAKPACRVVDILGISTLLTEFENLR